MGSQRNRTELSLGKQVDVWLESSGIVKVNLKSIAYTDWEPPIWRLPVGANGE